MITNVVEALWCFEGREHAICGMAKQSPRLNAFRSGGPAQSFVDRLMLAVAAIWSPWPPMQPADVYEPDRGSRERNGLDARRANSACMPEMPCRNETRR